MPEIGEVKSAKEIGRKGWFKYAWLPCEICGKERWVVIHNNNVPRYTHCQGCGNKLNIPAYTNKDNPHIGDIARGYEIGRKGSIRYIFAACIDCGKGHWTHYVEGKIIYQRCLHCANAHRRKVWEINQTPPYIGEIRHGNEIGRADKRSFVWAACPSCGFERWVRAKDDGTPITPKCWLCYKKRTIGSLHHRWNGGISYTNQGYRQVLISSDNPYFAMAMRRDSGRGYILEHRLIMAQHLGRCLESCEIVHHKNGLRDDNRIENLELTKQGAHSKNHSKGYRDGYRQGYQDGSNAKTQELLNRVKLLEFHLRESGVIITSDEQANKRIEQ